MLVTKEPGLGTDRRIPRDQLPARLAIMEVSRYSEGTVTKQKILR